MSGVNPHVIRYLVDKPHQKKQIEHEAGRLLKTSNVICRCMHKVICTRYILIQCHTVLYNYAHALFLYYSAILT
jgi:hypothetical protein